MLRAFNARPPIGGRRLLLQSDAGHGKLHICGMLCHQITALDHRSRSPLSITALDHRSRSPLSITALDHRSRSPLSITALDHRSRSPLSITALDHRSRSPLSITALDHRSRSPLSITALEYSQVHVYTGTRVHRYMRAQCTTLHYTTLHYTTLHYTALHCTTLHCTTLPYTALVRRLIYIYTTGSCLLGHDGCAAFCSLLGLRPFD